MKTKNILIIGIGVLLFLSSCIKDDSSLPDKQISEIKITAASDTINIDYGYELVYEPTVEQTMSDMPLTYEWSYQGRVKTSTGSYVNGALEKISTDKILKQKFKNIGEYQIRLKVSNEHGSTFKYYKLFVKAAFDQGIFVLSADDNKKGRVSFMRPLSREETEAGKQETFYTSAFSTVNPEFELNDPADAEKIGPDIFILSKKDNLVYRIDSRTFDLYNITDFKDEFSWMKPTALLSKDRSITNYIVLSEEGGTTRVNYKSDIAFDGDIYFNDIDVKNKLYTKYTGEPKPPSVSVTNLKSWHFFLNYEKSKLYYIYDLLSSTEEDFPNQNLINVVMDMNQMTCLVGRSTIDPNTVIITRGYADKSKPLGSRWLYSYQANDITLTRESIIQSNNTYNSIFYTNGNKLYRWYNWNASPVLPTVPVINLDGNKQITCFNFSQDHKELYLGVYDPSLSGMKGCIYVYDADALDPATNQLVLKKKFEGVADKPIKVFWKNNRL